MKENNEFAKWWAYWMSKVPPRPYSAMAGLSSGASLFRIDPNNPECQGVVPETRVWNLGDPILRATARDQRRSV